MNNEELKKQIAEEYIELHNKDNASINYWISLNKTPDGVYYSLVGGEYGDLEDNGMGDLVIEIGGEHRKDGNPTHFEIEYKNMNL